MNVGAIALVTGGALLMHAALTAQSPLTDLQSIFQSGKVAPITDALAGVRGTDPTGSQAAAGLPATLANLNHIPTDTSFPGHIIATPPGVAMPVTGSSWQSQTLSA